MASVCPEAVRCEWMSRLVTSGQGVWQHSASSRRVDMGALLWSQPPLIQPGPAPLFQQFASSQVMLLLGDLNVTLHTDTHTHTARATR
ncbi:hypothetical protein F751_2325 [Auxenochlorella protothecoides]|uniref:Uncharacterized protein n=1 Tax=Auxenochlorella protothecoides TaxID=3075 RepID=A0A087SFV3_AUXPR|nr:hypothetical protein F751_2325 [Auxenochlorella protothecoides]KFM24607.1 hypothetical protein F751_2325 [Auxenochlorella protothecoides]